MELREFARTVLFSPHLEEKLIKLDLQALTDKHPHGPFAEPAAPGRPKELEFLKKLDKRASFPTVAEMKYDSGRGRVLHFFANHELLALELMALALLKFPDAPAAFRLNIARTMLEEQQHLRLYLSRMSELGVGFGDIPVNDFFWQSLKGMTKPIDYVAGMSLTFEQANLDFSYHYWRIMRQLGDVKTANILEQVLRDEIGHVKFGLTWFNRWRPQDLELFDAQVSILRPPLSMSRAKGIGFHRELRMQVGLSKTYIDRLEVHGGSKGRPPHIYWYNPDCELELAHRGRGYQLSLSKQAMISEQMPLMMFLAKEGDLILCDREPSVNFLKFWKNLGFPIPEFFVFRQTDEDYQKLRQRPNLGQFHPWGWTQRAVNICRNIFPSQKDYPLAKFLDEEDFESSPLREFFRKDRLPKIRRRIRAEFAQHESLFGPRYIDGTTVEQLGDLKSALQEIWQNDPAEPAVVKPAFCSAGQNMRRLYSESDWQSNIIGWFNHHLEQNGSLLVEPWFDKLADFSVVWGVDGIKDETLSYFITDHKGHYKGHMLGAWRNILSPVLKRELFAKRNGISLLDAMLSSAAIIRSELADISYLGPAGVDFPVYRERKSGQVFVKCIGEINPRLTMGHVALSIEKRLKAANCLHAKQQACWRLLSQADLKHLGLSQALQVMKMVDNIQRQLPADQAIYQTSDPNSDSKNISLIAIGSEAVHQLQKKLS